MKQDKNGRKIVFSSLKRFKKKNQTTSLRKSRLCSGSGHPGSFWDLPEWFPGWCLVWGGFWVHQIKRCVCTPWTPTATNLRGALMSSPLSDKAGGIKPRVSKGLGFILGGWGAVTGKQILDVSLAMLLLLLHALRTSANLECHIPFLGALWPLYKSDFRQIFGSTLVDGRTGGECSQILGENSPDPRWGVGSDKAMSRRARADMKNYNGKNAELCRYK